MPSLQSKPLPRPPRLETPSSDKTLAFAG